MKSSKRKKVFRISWKLTFILFFLILLFDFADQSMINPLVNPLLKDFSFNTDRVIPIGWISFVFTIFSAGSMIVAGISADQKSRKKICIFGCFIYSTFSILTILVPPGITGYYFFMITRALNGIGVGVVIPTIFSMVGDRVDSKKRTTAFAYIALAIMIGRMSGFIIAGSFSASWRTGYFMLGIINLVLAFGLIFIREPKRGGGESELKNLVLEGAEYRFRFSRKDIKFIWTNKSNKWLVLNFIDVIPGSMILFLIFKYLNDLHNMKPDLINVLVLIVAVFGGAGTMVFGKMGDWGFKKNKRAKVIIALLCNLLPILFLIGFLNINLWIGSKAVLSESLSLAGFWMLAFMIGMAMFINQGVNPNWYSTLTDTNLPEHRATMISFASIMDMIGAAVGPLIASYFATLWGIKTAMWLVLIFWVVNGFLWIPVLWYIKKDLIKVHQVLKIRAAEMKKELKK